MVAIVKCSNLVIRILKGNLLDATVDAIVNPANTKLYMGGGVAGLIKRFGGDIVEKEALKHAPINIGRAIITTSGNLKCKYVIHAPTVVNPGDRSSFEYVRKAVKASLELANSKYMKTIAFPSMGTGVGGLKYSESARAMLSEIMEFIKAVKELNIEEIIIYLISDDSYREFTKVLEEIYQKYGCTPQSS